MSWIKLDDQWMDHPKIIQAGRDARDIWLASLAYCAKHLTDGYFPENLLPHLAVMAGVDVANCQSFARALLDVGLWERADDGYHIHDYTDYNPTKEQALATRSARSVAGKRGGEAKAAQFRQNPGKMLANSLANDVAKSKQNSAPSPSPSLNEEKKGASAPLSEKPGAQAALNDPTWAILHGKTPSNPSEPPPPDTTWLPADIVDMGAAFLTCSKIPPPPDKSTRGYWIAELRSMRINDNLTQDDIRAGIRKMRATGGLIKSPESVRTAALNMRASTADPQFSEVYQ